MNFTAHENALKGRALRYRDAMEQENVPVKVKKIKTSGFSRTKKESTVIRIQHPQSGVYVPEPTLKLYICYYCGLLWRKPLTFQLGAKWTCKDCLHRFRDLIQKK